MLSIGFALRQKNSRPAFSNKRRETIVAGRETKPGREANFDVLLSTIVARARQLFRGKVSISC